MRTHLPVVTFIFLGATLSTSLRAQRAVTETRTPAVEVALSDQAVQLKYHSASDIGGEGSRLFYSIFLSEERDVVGSAGLLLDSDLSVGSFDVRFGPQAYAGLLKDENQDVFALALGLEARLDLIRDRALAIVASAYYSPDVLTFGSADNLTDFMVRGEARINDRLVAVAGYRWLELDLLMRQDRSLQNEVFAGVRWQIR